LFTLYRLFQPVSNCIDQYIQNKYTMTIAILFTTLWWLSHAVISTNANMAGPAVRMVATPQHTEQQECDGTSSTTTTNRHSEYNDLFGIKTQHRRRVPCTASAELSTFHVLRGGGGDDEESTPKTVHTPTSVEDLDAILLKAGSEQQLVVIDFTATWCGPCQTIAPVVRRLLVFFWNLYIHISHVHVMCLARVTYPQKIYSPYSTFALDVILEYALVDHVVNIYI
jgi:thiol-disulfide isomerase/thioredoxin